MRPYDVQGPIGPAFALVRGP